MDRRWTSLLRELTDEAGRGRRRVDSSEDPSRPPYKWKLDSAEDGSQRGTRLSAGLPPSCRRDEDRDEKEKAAGSLGLSVSADEMSKLVAGTPSG